MDNTPIAPDALIINARKHIKAISMQYQDPQGLLYDDRLAFYLETLVQQFGTVEQVEGLLLRTARLAALFYPLGYQINRKDPHAAVQLLYRNFLQQHNAENLIPGVRQCLQAIYQRLPKEMPSKLLADALVAIHFNDDIHNWADLQTLEQELRDGPVPPLPLAELKLQQLLSVRFHTAAGKDHWQQLLGQQLLLQKKRLEKLRRTQTIDPVPEVVTPFSQLETNLPVRGAQTYFRAVYRNHINLSAIADNKANIMISVNSILISVLITFLSYRNIAETQPMVLLPVVIFLVTGLASLICAVLSARPKVTQLVNIDENTPVGLAFFGNFVHLSLEKFTAAMDETLQSSTLLYNSMVEDLYHLGKVLDKKYRYLSISYNIFMVGLIITVALFLITLFAL